MIMKIEKYCLYFATAMLIFVGIMGDYQLYQEGVRRQQRKVEVEKLIKEKYNTNSPDDQEMAMFLRLTSY